jgi:hypothetical protein
MAMQETADSSVNVYYLYIFPSSAMEALKDKNRKVCER